MDTFEFHSGFLHPDVVLLRMTVCSGLGKLDAVVSSPRNKGFWSLYLFFLIFVYAFCLLNGLSLNRIVHIVPEAGMSRPR